MATKKEQEQLMATLKFTPRTYKISLWGYGGEKVMGTVDRKVWDYCMEHQVDLQDIAWQDEETVVEDLGLDPEMLPFPPGQWYECDGMAHVNGVSRNAGSFQVEDENGNEVVQKSFDDCDGGEDSPQWACNDEVWVGMRKKGEVVFIGSSNEKGTFFEGEIELKAPFNIELLEFGYDEVDGEEIINTVMYDGEEIENWGGGTDGKSSDFNMVLLTSDDGEFERYEPGEKDWGHPEYGVSPSDWESSPKFKFKQHKPVYPGYYSLNYGYGSSYSSMYWDGENFGEWEYGKFNPINQEGIVTWQGYNWDTSSWANQPPEPPALGCKCGWAGSREDMREDDDYNAHCPDCDSVDDVDWIDYDPDTVKGRKNRAKYCKPWDPAQALEKIAVPESACSSEFDWSDDLSVPDYECVQCDWKGDADECSYDDNDENMICPECGGLVKLVEYNVKVNTNPWFDVKVAPTVIGQYEVKNTHTPAWPFPASFEATWNGKSWVDSDGDVVENVIEWRDL